MKKSIIPVAAFIAGMAIVPSAFADYDVHTSIKDWDSLAACLRSTEDTTCTLSETFAVTDLGTDDSRNWAEINGGKTITLNLNNKTLNVTGAAHAMDALITVSNGSKLVVKNGTINNTAADVKRTIWAGADGNLTVESTATIKGNQAVYVNGGNGRAAGTISIEGTLERTGASVAGAEAAMYVGTVNASTAPIINISGAIVDSLGKGYAYNQDGNADVTVTGRVEGRKDAIRTIAGNLTLDGATVKAAAGNAVVVDGGSTVDTVEIKNYSNVEATSDAIQMNGDLQTLRINKSTIKSTGASVFNGIATTEVSNVTIDDSLLIAKNDKTVIKAGETQFKEYAYDGDSTMELSDTYGSYGSKPVEPDQSADENKEDGETNPNTADTIATYITIATVALLGLGATAFVAKKSNR